MRQAASFRNQCRTEIRCPENELGPDASPGGGEGGCVRACFVDSESGGAKGHYPRCRTPRTHAGSAFPKVFSNFLVTARNRDRQLEHAGHGIPIEPRAELAHQSGYHPPVTIVVQAGEVETIG